MGTHTGDDRSADCGCRRGKAGEAKGRSNEGEHLEQGGYY
jgi:hypothetical protein